MNELDRGVVHGHIHNYNNLTYIHGHVHKKSKVASVKPLDRKDEFIEPALSFPSNNKIDCSKFEDCKHFNFINCHNLFQEPSSCLINAEGGADKQTQIMSHKTLLPQNPDRQSQLPSSKRARLNSCTQCQFQIMEVCCEQSHHNPEVPLEVVPFEKDSKLGSAELNTESSKTLDIFNLINWDFTCHDDLAAHDHDLSANTIDSSSTSSCDCNNKRFERLCKQSVSYDPYGHDQDYKNQYMRNLNGHFFDNDTDMRVLNDLVNISNTCEAPSAKLTDQPINLLQPSIYGTHTTDMSSKTLKQEADGNHCNHHHHRIELHNHVSNGTPNNSFLFDNIHTENINTLLNSYVDISDTEQEKNATKNAQKTNTINLNWSLKSSTTQNYECKWNDCLENLLTPLDLQPHTVKEYIDIDITLEPNQLCHWKDCNYISKDTDSFINHMDDTHGISFEAQFLDQKVWKAKKSTLRCTSSKSVKPGDDGTFRCEWAKCKIKLNSRRELNEHIEASHVPSGQSSYQCAWDFCHKNFTQRQKLLRHLKVHTGYKPFICSDCRKKFSTEDILVQHMRTHSGEKPFTCHYCDKRFSTSSSLRIHIRIHTGEKPLICKICGKKFNESSNLNKHIKVHKRKYMCDCCKRSFNLLEQYNNHVSKCGQMNKKEQPKSECLCFSEVN